MSGVIVQVRIVLCGQRKRVHLDLREAGRGGWEGLGTAQKTAPHRMRLLEKLETCREPGCYPFVLCLVQLSGFR